MSEAHFVVYNRTQLIAAIKDVPYNEHTIIDACNDNDDRLVRYTFPKKKTPRSRGSFDAHLKKLAREVAKTPADIWR